MTFTVFSLTASLEFPTRFLLGTRKILLVVTTGNKYIMVVTTSQYQEWQI